MESELMNLIDEGITHKVFGEGNIVDHDDSIITVHYNTDIKKIVYHNAAGKFITIIERNPEKHLKNGLLKRKKEEEIVEKEREEEKRHQALEQQRREKLNNHKIHESSQIVFWLDEEEQQNVFTEWEVFTGEVQSGKSKGQPNRAVR